VIIILLIVILPLIVIGALVLREASGIYRRIQSGELDLKHLFRQAFDAVPAWVSGLLNQAGPLRWCRPLNHEGDITIIPVVEEIGDLQKPGGFNGFFADTVPDANTIWTFREALTRAQLDASKLRQIDDGNMIGAIFLSSKFVGYAISAGSPICPKVREVKIPVVLPG
jgi:hypothetical protein